MRLLVTGGAGFIGSNLTVAMAERHPDWDLVATDNLHRPGSELNLPRIREAGAEFVEADVRVKDDLLRLGSFDAIVEAAAEPAVGADQHGGGSALLVETNLIGAYHCLELAARSNAHLIVLSTSRVYPVAALRGLQLLEAEERFELAAEQLLEGVSQRGVSERFPLDGRRTLYGATKLAAELLAVEYSHSNGYPLTINRLGVVAGPWQMGTSDQGVFAHWVSSYRRARKLDYIGWGGTGKQVRDLLHVDDLIDLLEAQLLGPDHWAGVTVNVGGGLQGSLSLREASAICRDLTGVDLEPGSVTENRPGDVPLYISDCTKLFALTDWRPRRTPRQTLVDILSWSDEHTASLEAI